jgi:predicted nucleic acid-binding Zn ribbon protein
LEVKTKPTRIGGLVEKVLNDLGLKKRVEEYRVIENWEQIVGKAVAENVIPVGVERGRLVVGVRSSPWMMEMRMRENDLMERITEWAGENVVKEIRFVRI